MTEVTLQMRGERKDVSISDTYMRKQNGTPVSHNTTVKNTWMLGQNYRNELLKCISQGSIRNY